MEDVAEVTCPYCFQQAEIYVDPETAGELIRDCDICCRPWAMHVSRGENGELYVRAFRAQ